MNNKFTIYENPSYFGSYIVVDNETKEQVNCHNLATARAHIRDHFDTPDCSKEIVRQMTLEEYYGCQTGGMGYTPAVTWLLTGRTERVHNWGTAKSIAKDFPVKQWSK
tara:strand:+ start:4132 stop:4455 length:324 start_codon:yes stop_codon:yes gene_type:complete